MTKKLARQAKTDRAMPRTISLTLSEWEALEKLSDIGSATREASMIIRDYLVRHANDIPQETEEKE